MILIIYAHPAKGHCSLMLEQVKKELDRQKKEYEVLDLYKMQFVSEMSADELYTLKSYSQPKEVTKLQEKIVQSQKLLVIYPVWWNGFPAILKGFFDRVFTAGFAFKFVRYPFVPFAVPRPLLSGKAVALTTTGAHGWMIPLFLGNRCYKQFKRDVMGYCGIKARNYSVHNCRKDPKLKLEDIQKASKKAISFLN